MTNESEARNSASAGGRNTSAEAGNPRTQPKQRIGGGAISRDEDKSGRVGGEGHVTQQSNADADGPSTQTSTAQDEKGQL